MSKDKMSLDRALELLKIERECVLRQNSAEVPDPCIRNIGDDCSNCDLWQDQQDIVDMYDVVVNLVSNYIDAQNSVKEWAGCI